MDKNKKIKPIFDSLASVHRFSVGSDGWGWFWKCAVMIPTRNSNAERSCWAQLAGSVQMPPRSTYFYPKVLSGLVINPLD